MSGKRPLFGRVEKLLIGLLDEAETVKPAVVDNDGVEIRPAIPGPSFGERLKLAEVASTFEARRAKINDDSTPSEIETMLGDFHADRTTQGRRSRKTRQDETDGLANNGRALDPFTVLASRGQQS
jgi:hypothetical protein